MPTAYLSHPSCFAHLAGCGHPECPERLSAIQDRLVSTGVFDLLHEFEAPRATIEELERVHTKDYIQRLLATAPDSGTVFLDADTPMDSNTLEAARRAAGAVIHATDLVMKSEATDAFCNIRPPGHHATRDKAMGFCFFNNIAVGAAHALETWGLKRVAIIDFDAHHGNGTEDIFQDESRILFCSAFQRDLFPSTEIAESTDRIANIELGFGAGGESFREVVRRIWSPALDEFRPEMIFVSAGFDAHAADSISDLAFSDDDYRWITEWIVDAAGRHAGGRLVSALEGGYDLEPLGRCAALHVRTMMGI